jgi:sporulation protein YlmC with PRC-barrel domain
MAVNLSTVQTGMDVLDPSGNKIGSVSDILSVQAYSETDTDTVFADPAAGTAGDLQTTSVTPDPSGQQTYLKVDQGGILGIGAKELYIPFSAVQNVVPGDNLTVNCTKDTCGNMYGSKPDFLP